MTSLARCESLLRSGTGVGPFSTPLLHVLSKLEQQGLAPPTSSAILAWLTVALPDCRRLLAADIAQLRAERVRRWRDAIPAIWESRPGVLFWWLQEETPVWGSIPFVGSSGLQCSSVAEVNAVVRGFWVTRVWGQHASYDPSICWAAIGISPFSLISHHISSGRPSSGRKNASPESMRSRSASGPRGLPIYLWQALPPEVHARLANLLVMVESTGV